MRTGESIGTFVLIGPIDCKKYEPAFIGVVTNPTIEDTTTDDVET